MMKKHTWKIIVGAVVLALVASVVFSQQAGEKANEGVAIEAHVKGNPDAGVVLVEYSDFQCPACKQFYPVVDTLMEEYGDQIRFEYRHFPLITIHRAAAPAARAAEAAAQQGKFWEMHDMLFENQTNWGASSNPNATFIAYAEELGLDTSLFRQHLNSSVISDAVSESFNEARELGFTGTPSFLLNGERMQFETFADFTNQIEIAIGVASSTEEEVETPPSESSGVRFGI